MRQLRPLADDGVLDLDEIADLDVRSDFRRGAKMNVWAERRTVGDFTFMRIAEMRRDMGTDLHVLKARMGADLAALADDHCHF